MFIKEFLVFANLFWIGVSFGETTEYRLCIPGKHLELCEQMGKDGNPNSPKIKCISANDKMDCIEKIVKDEADFFPLEPEEIYVAHRFKKDAFSVITEIRTNEFQHRDYRYEPVGVIRRTSGIDSISSLRSKKSCHTGFGRNAGWKVPFSHLMDKNEFGKLCDEIKAPTTEKDLYAVANYFDAACAPGSWVADINKDLQLKLKYSNLCSLCENPGTCARDDKYGGYEGALDCLVNRNADVAWTKLDSVQQYFKLNHTTPLGIVEEYSFLCWDGSSMPLTTANPCSWAKRPWRAILVSSRFSVEMIQELQLQITDLHRIALESVNVTGIIPLWLSSVLEFEVKGNGIDVAYHNPPHRAKLLTPSIYLDRNNYTVTIEKPSCGSKTNIKICLRSEVEKLKCMALRMAAMGRRILPNLYCVLGQSTLDCIEKVARGEADIVNLDPKDADWAKKNYQLQSILAEMEEIQKNTQAAPHRYALALVSGGSLFKNISELRGKRACFGSINSLAGWNVPVGVLRDLGLINGPTCGLSIQTINFFANKTCLPGALTNNMNWIPKSSCSLCAGDGIGPGQAVTPETMCADNENERYYGDTGVIKCLEDKQADVVFIDHVGLRGIKDKSEYRLLCPTGLTMELLNVENCNWGLIPSRKLMTRGGEDNLIEREDSRLTLLKIADTFGPGSSTESVMKLFGPYFGNKDLLFQDSSVGLCEDNYENSLKLISDFNYCTTSAATTFIYTNYYIVFISLTLLFK